MIISYLLLPLLVLFSGPQIEFNAYSESIPGTDVSIDLVPVTGGTFMMGSRDDEKGRKDDEGPQHEVMVDDFWIGQYEINWEQYEAFVFRKTDEDNFTADLEALGIDGVSAATAPYVDMSDGMGKAGYPAIGMTQYAALTYCKWLTAKTGNFYRLPTEAEWEYACRAGSSEAYSFGNDTKELGDYGVYKKNSEFAYARTGTKQPNQWEIYDMSGNVSEWVMDQYDGDFYASSESDNPWNRPETLYPRVVRGGSWRDGPSDCRCAARKGSKPRWKMQDPQIPKSQWWHTNVFYIGFRVVRPKVQPTKEEISNYWLEAIKDFGE